MIRCPCSTLLGQSKPLSLEKTLQLDVTPQCWRYERVRSVVVEMLAEKPDAKSTEMIGHMESEHGLKVGKSTVSRVRQDLGLTPDCRQSRERRKKDAVEEKRPERPS